MTTLVALALSTSAVVATRVVLADDPNWFVPRERMAAGLALRELCAPGDLVLGPPDVGLYAVGLSRFHALLAHPAAPDYDARFAEARAFYGTWSARERSLWLDRRGVTHLVLPGEARPLPAGWLGAETPFRLAARVGAGATGLGIYARPRPGRVRRDGPRRAARPELLLGREARDRPRCAGHRSRHRDRGGHPRLGAREVRGRPSPRRLHRGLRVERRQGRRALPVGQPEVVVLPAKATKRLADAAPVSGASLRYTGAIQTMAPQPASPGAKTEKPPKPLTAQARKDLQEAKKTYQQMLRSARGDDVTPELYYLSVLADYGQTAQMAEVAAAMAAKRPGDAAVKKVQDWVRAQSAPRP